MLLLAGERSPQAYPTRNPAIISTLLRLANQLQEVGGLGVHLLSRARSQGRARHVCTALAAIARASTHACLPARLRAREEVMVALTNVCCLRLQAETSVRLLRWCQQKEVPVDRNMWQRWA